VKGLIRCRRLRLVLLLVVALAILGASVSVASAKAPAGGPITLWATPTTAGASDLVIAGAIGDYGQSLNIDQNGKANPKGNYAQITLQKGSFRVNLTAFNAAANKASFPINKPSCSPDGAITAPVTISNGTGLYQGITGKGRITLTLVWILSSPSSGKCDGNKVLLHSQYLNGSGTVSFS
jgi:hypothetical protein